LLFGCAIHDARVATKKVASVGFMKIERLCRIRVATSIYAIKANGIIISILDPSGHKDFAEDTFRALTVVDPFIVAI
jgi:peptide subunit release factor RF-3